MALNPSRVLSSSFEYSGRSLAERLVGGVSHHSAAGFMLAARKPSRVMKAQSNQSKTHREHGKTALLEWFKANPKRLLWLLLLPFFLIWFAWVKSDWSKNARLAVTALSAVLLILTLTMSSTEPPKPELPKTYKVVAVIDGDTIDIDMNGKTERLRLIGIDTPETKDPRKPVQCFGKEASAQAHKLLDGKQVRLEADSSQTNRDKYDRLLRYVYFEDGTSYNKQIILDGYAHEYTYNAPYTYQSEYKQAQKDAETAQRGLWSPSTCNGNTERAAEMPTPTPPVDKPTSENNTYYANCTEARDAGAAPLYTGNAGYRSALDRDGDGIACE